MERRLELHNRPSRGVTIPFYLFADPKCKYRVNKNIQDVRRQACGYKDVDSFFNMILLRQGDLTFRF